MKYKTVWSIGAQLPNETFKSQDAARIAQLLAIGAIIEVEDTKVEIVEAPRKAGRPPKAE
jgi:hypothetical protein